MMRITAVMPESTLRADFHDDAQSAAARMDEETFRAFYDRTARLVWAYLCRMTGDNTLADDLLQETYFRFFRASGTYDNESHRRNAVFRIATNLARDEGRKRRRRIYVPVEGLDLQARQTSNQADHCTDLQRALQRIKPQQREILWLAYALGSTHQEIADIVGLSQKSIKSLLFRARRKVAALLRGERG